ncbi:MAG: hypothetical protein RL150_57 [Candidatus Parcubacteria bacterium]|jgi:hypothetical protein
MKKLEIPPRFGPAAAEPSVQVVLDSITLDYRRDKSPITARLCVSGLFTVPASLYPLLREEELFAYGKYCGALGVRSKLATNPRTFPGKGRVLRVEVFSKTSPIHIDRLKGRVRIYFLGTLALPAEVVTTRSREALIAFAVSRGLLGTVCKKPVKADAAEARVALPR